MDPERKTEVNLMQPTPTGSSKVIIHFRDRPPRERLNAMVKAGFVLHPPWTQCQVAGFPYAPGESPGYFVADVPKDKLAKLAQKAYVVRLESRQEYEDRLKEERRLAHLPFCEKCGPVEDDHAAFCARCGRRLCNAHICADCGATVYQGAPFCWACGARLLKGSRGTSVPPTSGTSAAGRVGVGTALAQAQDAVDARRADPAIPDIAKRWSWGAFALGWVWGIFNKVWISLLMILLVMVPIVGWIGCLIFAIVLGDSGKEWAWKNGSWRSVEHFRETQDMWDGAGIAYLLLLLTAAVVLTYTYLN